MIRRRRGGGGGENGVMCDINVNLNKTVQKRKRDCRISLCKQPEKNTKIVSAKVWRNKKLILNTGERRKTQHFSLVSFISFSFFSFLIPWTKLSNSHFVPGTSFCELWRILLSGKKVLELFSFTVKKHSLLFLTC